MPVIGSLMGAYDSAFSSAHGSAPPSAENAAQEASLKAAEASLAAAANIPELRAKQDDLMAKMEAQNADTGHGFDLAAQDTAMELMNVQRELSIAEMESASLEDALKAIGMTKVSPNVDSTLLDAAIRKVRELRAGLLLSASSSGGSGSGSGGGLDGRRAKGGPVSRGGVYLVGEDGPELMTASKSGYVHPVGKGAKAGSGGSGSSSGGGVQIGAIHINPSLSFPSATMADAEAIAKTVMGRIKDEIGTTLRGVMADVSMGY
jgi:hypothetical protein